MQNGWRIDRAAFEIVALQEADQRDREYWWALSPEERLRAMELMRQIAYGYDHSERIQRIFEVDSLERS